MLTPESQLAVHLALVAEAEAALETARDRARFTARALNLPTENIFGRSRYVLRSTAYRWTDEARADAVNDSDALDRAYRRLSRRPSGG